MIPFGGLSDVDVKKEALAAIMTKCTGLKHNVKSKIRMSETASPELKHPCPDNHGCEPRRVRPRTDVGRSSNT